MYIEMYPGLQWVHPGPPKSKSFSGIQIHFFFFKVAYGGSQVRGRIRGTAAGLHHSHSTQDLSRVWYATYTTAHSSTRSLTHWGQGSNLCPHGCQSDLFLLSHDGNSSNPFRLRILTAGSAQSCSSRNMVFLSLSSFPSVSVAAVSPKVCLMDSLK